MLREAMFGRLGGQADRYRRAGYGDAVETRDPGPS